MIKRFYLDCYTVHDENTRGSCLLFQLAMFDINLCHVSQLGVHFVEVREC